MKSQAGRRAAVPSDLVVMELWHPSPRPLADEIGRNSRISDLGRYFESVPALGQTLPLIRHEERRKAGTASRSNNSLGFERCLGEVH